MALYDVVRLPRAVCSIAFLALLSVAAGGCTSLREAGTCHVAVLSVTRWDDYKSELQPKFVLDANSALTKATPDTMVLEQAILDVFRAKVGLKLAPSKQSPATQPKDANGVGALPPKQISDANLPDSFRSARSEKDPMLEYLAATALYQEVKMLNRYITDASIRNGYKGYVVRLQIAQMPGIRKANYDLYMNIGFYFGDFNKSDAQSRNAFLKDPSTPLVVPLLVTDQVEGALLSRRAERLTEIVLAMSAAYAGISGEANVDAISQSIERALGRSYNSLLTVGRQGDNVLRVRLGARQIPGSRDEYQAIPRTHNVSLLVLVPEDKTDGSKTVFIGTRHQLRRPDSGALWWPEILDLRKIPADINERNNVADAWKRVTRKSVWCHDKYNEDLLWNAAHLAENGRYKEFLSLFGEDTSSISPEATIADLNRLWLDFVSANTYSPYDRTQFTLPKYLNPVVPRFECTGATLLDDGNSTVATISKVGDIDPDTVSAIWTFVEDPNQPQKSVTFASTRTELRGRNQLLLTFPSPKKFNRSVAPPPPGHTTDIENGKPIDPRRQLLYVTCKSDSTSARDPNTVALEWVYALANKPEPTKAMTVARSIEKLPCNAPCSADLVLDFAKEGEDDTGNAKDGFWMQIASANLDPNAATPPPSDPPGILTKDKKKPFCWQIKKAGTVTLKFKPLAPGTSVKVSFGSPDGMAVEPGEFVFPVSDSGS